MDDERHEMRIGELAELSGLTVKTIRFYSDRGLLPPAGRSESRYRLYDERALARLELIRAMRELGAGLAEIREVLDRELTLAELVRIQLGVVETQLRALRVRRATLRAIASGEYEGKELKVMTELTKISDEERKRIVEDFLDEVLGGLDIDPGLESRLRGGLPDLPEDPEPEQVEAWIELAELVRDADFRASIRRMAEQGAAQREGGEGPPGGADMQRLAGLVAERGGAALAAGTAPEAPEAQDIAAEISAAFAEAQGGEDSPEFRAALADQFASGTDARAERYWQLLAMVNGWPPVPTTVPAWEWTVAALRASA